MNANDIKHRLGTYKVKEEIVDIDGMKIIVKELNAGEASEYTHSMYTFDSNNKLQINKNNAEFKLIALSCYTEDGNKLFEIGEIELIKTYPQWVVDKLYNAAKKLSSNKEKARKN